MFMVPSKSQRERKVRRAGSTVFDHCIAAAAHRREGWIFTIPMRFDSALTTVKRFDEWITEFSEDLAARGQVIDKDVEYEIYRALSAPSGALVMMVPCWSLVDIDRSQEKFLDKCGQRFRAVRHRMLCPGVQALIANNLCAPVPHNERFKPPPLKYKWQTSGAERPLPDTPDLGADIICPDHSPLLVPFTLPETIRDVVRRAMAHATNEDICFVHFPREEVPDWLLQAQGIEPASVGVIYTLTRQTLRRIQEECAASPVPSLPSVAWNLNMVPLLPRDIFSVAVQSARGHTRRDSVIEFYVPAQAGATVGMTMVHFFAEDEANAFVRRLRHRAGGA
jgi:hypothetical protein